MTRVIFKLNFEEDLKNHTVVPFGRELIGKKQKEYLPKELVKLAKGKSQTQFKKIARNYLKDYYKKNKIFLNLAVKQAEEAWKLVEKKFFERLEKITKRKICANKFTANLTLMQACPYSFRRNQFMFSYKSPPIWTINTCAHEIMHIQIINTYRDQLPKGPWSKGKIPSEFAWHLIEGLNFLLDEEFSDILPFKDVGYPVHQKLRKRFVKEWRKTKDFEKFLPKAIEITKKMMK